MLKIGRILVLAALLAVSVGTFVETVYATGTEEITEIADGPRMFGNTINSQSIVGYIAIFIVIGAGLAIHKSHLGEGLATILSCLLVVGLILGAPSIISRIGLHAVGF